MGKQSITFRIGFGHDIHRLEPGRELWLGGIRIEHETGLRGHSDADALIHAICDALLGAAALRDIGYHFSDKDPRWKGADSKELLRSVVQMLESHHRIYRVGNIDATILAEAPRLNPHIPAMKKVLASILGIHEDDISIKAGTNEGMDAVGRAEAMTAYAVALIYSDSTP